MESPRKTEESKNCGFFSMIWCLREHRVPCLVPQIIGLGCKRLQDRIPPQAGCVRKGFLRKNKSMCERCSSVANPKGQAKGVGA